MTLDMTFEAREKIFRREEREEGAKRAGMSVDAFDAIMKSK